MKINMPKDVKDIIDIIYENGYEAFIVGGCVRDSIVGIIPNDYDITTNAKPHETIDIFKGEKIIETGIKHGTISLIKNKNEYEITTYRIDGDYNDNRRPQSVEFTSDIIKDLKRRDFTINSIAYNHMQGMVDEFDGIGDIERKIIKTVGNADERFEEDGLRIIRAVRFSSKLNFDIEPKTLKSIYKNINLIKNISAERIQEELNKILLSDNPEKIYILYDAKLFDVLKINNVRVNKKDLLKIKSSKKDLAIRLSIFIYILGDINESKKILDLLKYSNKIKSQCITILDHINENIIDDKISIKIYLKEIGHESLNYLLYAKKILDKEFENKYYEKIKNLIKEIDINKECYSLKQLALNGSDLKRLGYRGKEIGEKLNLLLNKVIENPNINNKEELNNIISRL
ncbi:CCA tRNA nucleotidyltransferase [Paraclostridium ghonii]|uniref:CCA tRNA nucleotidyltransferase n=1 Tax=Paraclostridium ghonii TaxID=29358 RepID=UPI00202CE8BE|nr:CCA tRNA nucleotidyltransferase [Paeniclostridium ghonii]MCM0165329.1 CCA tRNA nucleotidyltransferase [Paeniclostridium ghonii]